MARINGLTLILLAMTTMMIGRLQVKATRVDMQRVWSRNMTNAVHRGNARLNRLETPITGEVSLAADLGVPVKRGQHVGEFMMTMGIGTPPRKMIGIVDTGSNLIWTQSQRCTSCDSQPDHIFEPAKSRTYNKLSCSSPLCSALPTKTCTPDCEYTYFYGDESKTQGVLSKETFTMWNSSGKPQSIPGMAFGCSYRTQGDGFSEADGLVGLGRGSLSLISQIGSTVGSKFSYCLTSYASKSASETSPLFFGSAADLKGTNIMPTPMIKNSARPDLDTFYYISVKGIRVGTILADIPAGTLDIGKDGEGGFIIDSGTTLTYLSPKAFNGVSQALDSALGWNVVDGSHYGYNLCYVVPLGVTQDNLPNVTFHMGGGADYVVEGKYNFALVDPDKDLLCLLMLEMAQESAAKVPSILGNFQQQNIHILFDNDNEEISFTPASCSDLSQPDFDKRFMVSGSPASTLALVSFIVIFIFHFINSTLS
ncbi:aspartic proteinase nepenthesin-2-like [Cryptomeria japonica]|uniref:aspartic proteinase nepenthesin-2-like n=1 Tax=Cryptomeria japonica TaxID=3369 RepID=UPI0027DA941A|nr:aspartic proteinase nepenthesin-2-like [Cryptomeria japonica]